MDIAMLAVDIGGSRLTNKVGSVPTESQSIKAKMPEFSKKKRLTNDTCDPFAVPLLDLSRKL
jgi:hypothetical protein